MTSLSMQDHPPGLQLESTSRTLCKSYMCTGHQIHGSSSQAMVPRKRMHGGMFQILALLQRKLMRKPMRAAQARPLLQPSLSPPLAGPTLMLPHTPHHALAPLHRPPLDPADQVQLCSRHRMQRPCLTLSLLILCAHYDVTLPPSMRQCFQHASQTSVRTMQFHTPAHAHCWLLQRQAARHGSPRHTHLPGEQPPCLQPPTERPHSQLPQSRLSRLSCRRSSSLEWWWTSSAAG